MKNILLLFVIAFTLGCCEKDNSPKPVTELEKLPPATQTGANTVGCLLDGKAFKPDMTNNSLQCYYQVVNYDYYFYLRFSNHTNLSPGTITAIYVASKKKQIFENEVYDLLEGIDGNLYGAISIGATFPTTTNEHKGELKITKFDPINYIVSGIFWFDVEDKNGVVHQIREGRFDMHYTN